MRNRAFALVGSALISLSCFAAPAELDCDKSEGNLEALENVAKKVIDPPKEKDCPEMTEANFAGICSAIKDRTEASPESKLSYKYQEKLYKASCTEFTADPKVANKRIQKLWNANKEKFACKNFNNVSIADGNLLKFSIDTGFPEFLTFSVLEYNLDVNFKDPADGRTIMDFIKWQLERHRKSGNKEMIEDYEDAQKVLKEYGAKESSEL